MKYKNFKEIVTLVANNILENSNKKDTHKISIIEREDDEYLSCIDKEKTYGCAIIAGVPLKALYKHVEESNIDTKTLYTNLNKLFTDIINTKERQISETTLTKENFKINKILPKLINEKTFLSYKGDVVYTKFLNMYCVYVHTLFEDEDIFIEHPISTDLLYKIDMTKTFLHEMSILNLQKKQISINTLEKTIVEILSNVENNETKEKKSLANQINTIDKDEQVVIKYTDYTNGATTLLDKTIFTLIAQRLDTDLNIIPSSTSELIICSSEVTSVDDLQKILREVNKDLFKENPEEMLIDNIIRFSKETQTFSIIL